MKKKLTNEPKVTNKKIEAIVSDETKSKSERIRMLFDIGMTVTDISKAMNIRYNFAYNIVSNYSIVNDIEIVANKKESKKDKIVELYLKGLSKKEIAIELKSNYNYIFNVIKKYNIEMEATDQNESK